MLPAELELACRGEDPELWFSIHQAGIIAAKKICSECPAVEQCLIEAMTIEESISVKYRYGIYGAKTGKERHNIKRLAKDSA